MSEYLKGQAHLRRLYRAPDSPHEILATCDKAYVPSLTYTPATRHVAVNAEADEEGDDGQSSAQQLNAAPRVRLPFPAIDIAWCPFKKGDSDASFVTACRGQPLQLWDCEDAALRASYVATNDSDYHVHAHAVCWFAQTSHPHWIAGGYGGFEDATQVRVYDVVAEGKEPVWSYAAQRTHGLVSSLLDCAWPGTASLLAIGYYNLPTVHLLDCRHRRPAAELHGLAHGAQTLRVSAIDPYHFYAGGSQGDSRIACWDVRQPRVPLFTLTRSVKTNQVFEFDVLPAASSSAAENGTTSNTTRRLVTSSSDGGVVVHTWKAGEVPVDGAGVTFAASVGPTSGLTVIDADTIVVTTGSRGYDYNTRNVFQGQRSAARARENEEGGARRSAAMVGDVHGDGDSDGDDAPAFPLRKRARSPMAEESDVEDAEAAASNTVAEADATATAEANNVAVITLH